MMDRSVRRWVSILMLSYSLAYSSQLSAQTNQDAHVAPVDTMKAVAAEGPKPEFTSKSRLVLLPVVVTGKNGAHMGGLGRASFRIEEQGKTRDATVFEEVKTVAPDTKSRPTVALEGRSNFSLGDAQNWHVTIVLLDMLNTPVLYQVEGKRRLIQYLSRSLKREEPTALFGLRGSGLKQLHPFTTDTGVLIAALKKVREQVGQDEINEQSAAIVGDMAADLQTSTNETAQQVGSFLNDQSATMNAFQQRESIRTTLTAMTQIARAYGAIPGRKTLIWASGGFPFLIDDPQSFARMGTDMTDKYEETWKALAEAQVAVYTVDVTGLSGSTNTASGNFDSRRSAAGIRPGTRMSVGSAMNIPYDKGAEKNATLCAMADATGGIPCVNTNDLEKCFAQALDDSRAYYLLGYYLPADDQKPGWRKLRIEVDAPGAHVRARKGFYVSAPSVDTPETREKEIANAVRSPVEFTGVRINVREEPVNANSKPAVAAKSFREFTVGVLGDSLTVDVQNGNAVDLTLLAVAYDAGSKSAAQSELHVASKLTPERLEKLRKSALGVKQSLELGPGKYTVRFAVRDNLNGEIGSVEYPLEVK
jgi:VWFA-related protein